MHLRNASTKLMKDIWYGKEYKYVHNDSSAKDQEHFPKELKGRKYV
jgi:putative ATPase